MISEFWPLHFFMVENMLFLDCYPSWDCILSTAVIIFITQSTPCQTSTTNKPFCVCTLWWGPWCFVHGRGKMAPRAKLRVSFSGTKHIDPNHREQSLLGYTGYTMTLKYSSSQSSVAIFQKYNWVCLVYYRQLDSWSNNCSLEPAVVSYLVTRPPSAVHQPTRRTAKPRQSWTKPFCERGVTNPWGSACAVCLQ